MYQAGEKLILVAHAAPTIGFAVGEEVEIMAVHPAVAVWPYMIRDKRGNIGYCGNEHLGWEV